MTSENNKNDSFKDTTPEIINKVRKRLFMSDGCIETKKLKSRSQRMSPVNKNIYIIYILIFF